MDQFREGLLAEAAVLGPSAGIARDGLVAARVKVRGVWCTVAYRLDVREHHRRRAAGLGAVTTLGWLDVLLGLPVGLPVPVAPLTPTERRIIPRLPAGCVKIGAAGIVRTLVAPLDVDLVVVSAQDWRPGLKAAAQFANYCTRVLALTGAHDDLTDARLHAELDGVGLVVNALDEPAVVVAAEPFVKLAHTCAGWRFTEEVYGQVGSRQSPDRSAAGR